MLPKKTVRELLKEATKLKKSGMIEQAIKSLEQAYNIGEYSYPSEVVEPDDDLDLDNILTTEDLVRKSKYLQEVGKFDEALNYINNLILETSKRSKLSVWEIFDLSKLYNHRAIILKRDKKYKEEFVDRIKSYCLDGMATRLRMPIKPIGDPEDDLFKLKLESYKNDVKRIKTILVGLTENTKLIKFISSNSKKLDVKLDKNLIAAFMMRMIMMDIDAKKSLSEFDKLIK